MVDRKGTEANLLDLVGKIYDCAVDPTRWPAVLERVTRLLDGQNAVISLNNVAKPQFTLRAQWNVDPEFEAAMLPNYPSYPLLPEVWYSGVDEPISLLSRLDEDEVKKSAWYGKTMGAYGYRDAIISLLAKSSAQFGSISIQREMDKPPFDDADLNLMRRLGPHVRRAVLIGDLLDARAIERDVLSATLEMLTIGVLLTDQAGRIVHANGAAARMLQDGSAAYKDRDTISARDSGSARDLAQAIADAARGTTVDIPRAGIVVPLKGSSGHDLAAWVLPLDGGLRRDLGATFAARVAVFLREIGDVSPLPAELFVRRYGITQAECRVLLLIVQGMTPQEAANALGVSLTTAKTHISRLFDKTGTQRQVDLVRLAMSAMAPASM